MRRILPISVEHWTRALTRWEPRIELIDVTATADDDHDAALLVEIAYEIKATHDQRSIVYPFFLQEGSSK